MTMLIFLFKVFQYGSPTKIIRIVKSITVKEIFKGHPEVNQELQGGEFWYKGF